jgi:hypothetical protein
MQALTLLMIVAVTTIEFLTKGDRWGNWALLPGGSQFTIEILSAAAGLYVVVAGTRARFEFVRGAYWILFGLMLAGMTAGVLANSVEAGPIFAGIRTYLRAIPWFFIPIVYAFSNKQLEVQLTFLLMIGILQIPLAVQQAMRTMSRGFGYTGDFTSGSLLLSPWLSLFVICGICIAAGLYARNRLSNWQFVVIFVLLLFPATINETKATLLLLPLGVGTTFMVASRSRLRTALISFTVISVFVAVFVPIYDYMISTREYAVPIGEMLSSPERLEKYMMSGKEVGVRGEVGRLDIMKVAVKLATVDPIHFAFGYGIGNVSESALGAGFTGRHAAIYSPFSATSFGRLLLELGVGGLCIMLAILWLIFADALKVARKHEGLRGGLAAGWAGATVAIVVAIPYTDLITPASLSYLFWYFSGVVAADRMRDAHMATRPC